MVVISIEVDGDVYGLLDTALELGPFSVVVIGLVFSVKTVVVPLMTVTVVLADEDTDVDVVPLSMVGPRD